MVDEYECICFMEYGGGACLYAVSVLRDKTIIGDSQFTCDQCWSVDKLRGCRRDDGGTVTEADESECRFRGRGPLRERGVAPGSDEAR
jgi:hypothetical protein